MFCFQCQEAAGGKGCSKVGVCGKTNDVANIQDLLLYVTKGYAFLNQIAREKGVNKEITDRQLIDNLFATITNANFDYSAFVKKVNKTIEFRNELFETLKEAGALEGVTLHDCVTWTGDASTFDAKADSDSVGVLSTTNEDVRSLRELITYGVKGMAAYAEHAHNLGYYKPDVVVFMEEALAATLDDTLSAEDLVALTLKTGKYGVDVMALLDEANTSTYGNPELTEVNIGTRNNPAILISGHDLKDMEELLKQTQGTGVDVYTHSEMLPANYYPAFKKYEHFVGNYGNAWWKQREEFESFNGPILFTTNCIVPPTGDVVNRIYTTGASGFPGCQHIPDRRDGEMKDFSAIIEHAKKLPAPTQIEEGKIVGGFAHNQVLALADKVVDAV
ncbi:MAG: hydroxylamine reductase, partial [Clostridia bacterium]|nr:hydroxylamine reductase [Clostridia bacterium]